MKLSRQAQAEKVMNEEPEPMEEEEDEFLQYVSCRSKQMRLLKKYKDVPMTELTKIIAKEWNDNHDAAENEETAKEPACINEVLNNRDAIPEMDQY